MNLFYSFSCFQKVSLFSFSRRIGNLYLCFSPFNARIMLRCRYSASSFARKMFSVHISLYIMYLFTPIDLEIVKIFASSENNTPYKLLYWHSRFSHDFHRRWPIGLLSTDSKIKKNDFFPFDRKHTKLMAKHTRFLRWAGRGKRKIQLIMVEL